jgi:hypothetical protein
MFQELRKVKFICQMAVLCKKWKMYAVSVTPRAQMDERFVRPWQPLKRISIKNFYVCELSYHTTTKWYNLKCLSNKKICAWGVNDTANWKSSTKKSNFFANTKQNSKRLYSGNQGPREDCLMKKTRRSKILWHCPFNKATFGPGM